MCVCVCVCVCVNVHEVYMHACMHYYNYFSIWEQDTAPWKERSLIVRWVIGSILHGGPIELFFVLASAPRLV